MHTCNLEALNFETYTLPGMQGVACSAGGRLRLPILKPQTFALSLVGGLLGFLLSLFNSNGLDRWWKTRDCLG
jgi:hypothetical protein